MIKAKNLTLTPVDNQAHCSKVCSIILTAALTLYQWEEITVSEYSLLLISQAVGFGIFLWLGLYVLSRASRHTPIVITTLVGLFAQAAFFLSDHLVTITHDQALHGFLTRISWWDNVVPMAVWFHLSSMICREKFYRRGGTIFTPAIIAAYLAAAVLSLLGMFTNLVLDHDSTRQTGDTFYTGPGVGFLAYIFFLASVGLSAFVNLGRTFVRKRRNHQPDERIFTIQLALLATGAMMFLAGGLWLASRLYWRLAVSELPGDLFVIVGLLILGYGIANFDLLLEGQNGQRDFIYSFTGVALINLLYASILSLFGLNSIYSLLIVGLVTVSHSMVDFGRQTLDKLFFSKDEQAARSDARAFALALASAPASNLTWPNLIETSSQPISLTSTVERLPDILAAPLTEFPNVVAAPSPSLNPELPAFQSNSQKEFNDLVRKAITGLKNPTQMVKSPLLSLKIVGQRLTGSGQADNRLNRAAALREILIEQIESLRPGDMAGTVNRIGDAWRFYNVLHYPYVREVSRKGALAEARRLSEERRRSGQREAGQFEQVLTWLVDVDEDTFYKWQRRASDTVASSLWEQEFKTQPAAKTAAIL